MFHTMIFSAFIIPNIYVFIRIWKLFINKGYRLHYTLIYILLASIYPLGLFFNESGAGFIITFLGSLGNYLLPFYLYLFLCVLALDILLLINRLIKFIPSGIIKSTRFKIAGLSVILFFSAGVVIAGIINFNTIRTSVYKIEIPGKLSEISHLKIAFAADFHLQDAVGINFVERFANKIEKINPDLMIFGGDIVEGDREDENMKVFEKLLSGIHTRYGVFAVLGNHEYYAGQEQGSFFNKAGIKVLCDTILVIDSSFNLGGRFDTHLRSRKSIDDIMSYADTNLPVIMVDHRPTDLERVSKTAVDVQLSGHTHNGQLFPLNLIIRRLYRLSRGYEKIGNTHFFVTSGIRLWGPPVRTTGKSEIMVIDITFSGKEH